MRRLLLRRQHKRMACQVGGMREFALSVAIVGLASCALPHTHAPAELPAAQPPAKATTGDAPPLRVVVLEPRTYEQDKNRVKLALAKNTRDALALSDVGYYMDVLQARLIQTGGSSTRIVRQGDRIDLDFPSVAGFDSHKAQISPAIRALLTALSKVLVEYRMTLVSVQVRADESDSQPISSRLTEQREQAVAHYLAETGVAGKRIVIAGSGTNPPATADNPMHIELQLEPIVRKVGGER